MYVPFWQNTRKAVTSYRAYRDYGSCDGRSAAETRESVEARIVYFYAVADRIVLLYAYSKDEKEDLTNADRKNLKTAAAELKAATAKDKPRSHD